MMCCLPKLKSVSQKLNQYIGQLLNSPRKTQFCEGLMYHLYQCRDWLANVNILLISLSTSIILATDFAVTGTQRPTYPSSKPTKDWDKLEAQVKKEEKDEKLDGDAALNKFFQDIYADADEDTRRAMKKSFVESNGTVLSTNWKEVGSKKVEGSPPDGMEMKKWEY
ncbi:hypothetical protein Patl1_20240 [Pistacia atlantica]|uniref:Uncharacterized protein n=1 Tax=Pistacia atlantica TaxID=434234 RepID=A0ACC1BL32_9ROSI|nr:hypothetical protein Patl1_20240 [Pistacia atlantica]